MLYLAKEEDDIPLADATKALAGIDFDRPDRNVTSEQPLTTDETVFAGTLVDPDSGKVGSGRPAWEAAAEDLREIIRDSAA